MTPFAVIIPAAGSSTRFGQTRSKLVAELAGISVIARAVLPFVQRNDVRQILIAVPNHPAPAGRADEIFDAISREPAIKNRLGGQIDLVPGGSNRAESVRSALRLVAHDVEYVAIHDAARPLLSQDLIDRTLAAAIDHGAAGPALPVSLTIKRSPGPLPAKIIETVPRDQLWAMQTPQIARRELLERAFANCPQPLDQITDDLQLLELTGQETWLVAGEEINIKVTTPLDLRLAEMLIR